MTTTTQPLPALTFVIEWENAIDVDDDWTLKAMGALETELRSVAAQLPAKPVVMYLYDKNEVKDGAIEDAIARIAPNFDEVADVRVIPTDGLSYYKLKNYGIARSQTELTVMVDSDAAPEPGWLSALLKPFADPEVMAVGGFTRLGYETLLDKAMALSWVFNLGKEAAKTEKRQKIHVNNCAVRTKFFQANPFPDLQAFKKQCVFWLQGIIADGHKFVRTGDARVVHAPHPGVEFLAWRAWTGGIDSDFLAFHTRTPNRLGRFLYAFRYFARKTLRAWKNIWKKGDQVELPVWQRPAAMLISLAFYTVTLVSQLVSSLSRRFDPLPPRVPLTPVAA